MFVYCLHVCLLFACLFIECIPVYCVYVYCVHVCLIVCIFVYCVQYIKVHKLLRAQKSTKVYVRELFKQGDPRRIMQRNAYYCTVPNNIKNKGMPL